MNFDADEFLSLLRRLIRERVPIRTGMDAVIEQVSSTWDCFEKVDRERGAF